MKYVDIDIDYHEKPMIRPVVVHQGEEVSFTPANGNVFVLMPHENFDIKDDGGNPTFSLGGSGLVFMVQQGTSVVLEANQGIEALKENDRYDLIVDYSVACIDGSRRVYFAEGGSPPRIIIPPR